MVNETLYYMKEGTPVHSPVPLYTSLLPTIMSQPRRFRRGGALLLPQACHNLGAEMTQSNLLSQAVSTATELTNTPLNSGWLLQLSHMQSAAFQHFAPCPPFQKLKHLNCVYACMCISLKHTTKLMTLTY